MADGVIQSRYNQISPMAPDTLNLLLQLIFASDKEWKNGTKANQL
jgi:hypothetical protein